MGAAKAPTHEIFNVVDGEGDNKARWDKIGVGWGHEDGLGITLAINYLPVDRDAMRLVIRRVKARAAA